MVIFQVNLSYPVPLGLLSLHTFWTKVS